MFEDPNHVLPGEAEDLASTGETLYIYAYPNIYSWDSTNYAQVVALNLHNFVIGSLEVDSLGNPYGISVSGSSGKYAYTLVYFNSSNGHQGFLCFDLFHDYFLFSLQNPRSPSSPCQSLVFTLRFSPCLAGMEESFLHIQLESTTISPLFAISTHPRA